MNTNNERATNMDSETLQWVVERLAELHAEALPSNVKMGQADDLPCGSAPRAKVKQAVLALWHDGRGLNHQAHRDHWDAKELITKDIPTTPAVKAAVLRALGM